MARFRAERVTAVAADPSGTIVFQGVAIFADAGTARQVLAAHEQGNACGVVLASPGSTIAPLQDVTARIGGDVAHLIAVTYADRRRETTVQVQLGRVTMFLTVVTPPGVTAISPDTLNLTQRALTKILRGG